MAYETVLEVAIIQARLHQQCNLLAYHFFQATLGSTNLASDDESLVAERHFAS